ncbi:MAG: sarcosine oxidase subunit gamma family protein [Gammaproteobacteria bacterium]
MSDEAPENAVRTAGSRLELAPALHRWSVRARASEHAALEHLFGVTLPVEHLRSSTSEQGSALWLGPDEWLVLMPPHAATGFRRRYIADGGAALPCSAVDITHRNVGVRLGGAAAQSVLNAGCPLDLAPAAFPPGACTRTLFGKAEIVLWRLEESQPEFHIECWRSFLPYLWQRLRTAADEN